MTSTRTRCTIRPLAVLLAGCTMLLGTGSLTGCGSRSTAAVPEPSPTGSVAASCAAVMSALPQQVAGQNRSSSTANTASWGDPAITLRCGVPRPAGLTATSRCDEVDAVGWYTEEFTQVWRFTTIGRVGYIEVTVPAVRSPAADALVDLAPTVRRMASVRPCQ